MLKTPQWPDKWPFYDDDFNRMDESSDGDFYSQPRLVYHIGQSDSYRDFFNPELIFSSFESSLLTPVLRRNSNQLKSIAEASRK